MNLPGWLGRDACSHQIKTSKLPISPSLRKKSRVILENFTNDERDPSNPKELLLHRVNVDGTKGGSGHVMGQSWRPYWTRGQVITIIFRMHRASINGQFRGLTHV
jgi:hypothetical protein